MDPKHSIIKGLPCNEWQMDSFQFIGMKNTLKFISPQCTCGKSFIVQKLEVHSKIF